MKPNRKWTSPKVDRFNGLLVSNENVCWPTDEMTFQTEFCSLEERQEILRDLSQRDFTRQGYDRSIRVQRYSLADSDVFNWNFELVGNSDGNAAFCSTI